MHNARPVPKKIVQYLEKLYHTDTVPHRHEMTVWVKVVNATEFEAVIFIHTLHVLLGCIGTDFKSENCPKFVSFVSSIDLK